MSHYLVSDAKLLRDYINANIEQPKPVEKLEPVPAFKGFKKKA